MIRAGCRIHREPDRRIAPPAGAAALSFLALILKALTTAVIVVAASLVAERTRPFLAAMVLSLPVSTGPAYVLLALDHDAPFIAEAALASLAGNVAIVPAALAYAALARRGSGLIVSYAGLIAAWVAAMLLVRAFTWTTTSAVLLNLAVFAVAIAATWGWRTASTPPPARRRWFDIPLRAAIVVAVVVSVILVSERVGPSITGYAALFPASYSSFILLMHRRLGGNVVAAAFINGLVMLVGFTAFLLAIHLFARAGYVWTGTLVGLALPILWSALLLAFIRFRRPSRA